MKKFTIILAAGLMMAGFSASAQNLGSILGKVANAAGSVDGQKAGNILNTISNVVYAYTGNTNAVSLPGNWSYAGSAIALGGDNALTNIAGTAASATVESKVDGYLSKVGLVPGALNFTFNEDLTFTCTVKGIPVNGTWSTLEDGSKVQLKFGKAMKFINLTGTLKNTATGCEMLFEGKKFLNFVKTIMSYVGKQSAAASAVSSLAGNYNDMQIGFKLNKVK